MACMQDLCQAKTEAEFINASKPLFQAKPVHGFNKRVMTIKDDDYFIRLFHMLRKSKGNIRKLLSAIVVYSFFNKHHGA